MSWGPGQYMDYCYKVKDCIEQNDSIDIKDIINKKWRYVSKHTNINKRDFVKDITSILK